MYILNEAANTVNQFSWRSWSERNIIIRQVASLGAFFQLLVISQPEVDALIPSSISIHSLETPSQLRGQLGKLWSLANNWTFHCKSAKRKWNISHLNFGNDIFQTTYPNLLDSFLCLNRNEFQMPINSQRKHGRNWQGFARISCPCLSFDAICYVENWKL